MARLQAFKKYERGLTGTVSFETTAKTSARMSRVGRAATKPELLVRRYLTTLGLRYTTKNRDLPGSPDLANRKKKWAVFVHGCFWHQHWRCKSATIPKSNAAFWRAKFASNKSRDGRVQSELESLGFTVIAVWECQSSIPALIGEAVAPLRSELRTLINTR